MGILKYCKVLKIGILKYCKVSKTGILRQNEVVKLGILNYSRLEMLVREKHSCVLDPFISYIKNEVLWIHSLVLYSQPFIFFETYKLTNKLECYITLVWKGLPGTKTLAIGPLFISYEENKCCEYAPWYHINNLLFSSKLTNGAIS
jgi:hypothetical protein